MVWLCLNIEFLSKKFRVVVDYVFENVYEV